MSEEYASFKEIIYKNFTYLFSDRRRVFKFGIYVLYMYLFGKRFILIMKYFKYLVQNYLLFLRNTNISPLPKNLLTTHKSLQHRSFLKSLLIYLLKFLKFSYSLLITLQLFYLGYVEGIRLKNLIRFVANNSKKIRVKDNKQECNNSEE